jgi:hypothetical protein
MREGWVRVSRSARLVPPVNLEAMPRYLAPFLLTAALLAAAGPATAPAHASTRTPADPGLSAFAIRTSRFVITNATDSTLRLVSQGTDHDGAWRLMPGDIAARGIGDYTVFNNNGDADGTLQYAIGDTGAKVSIVGKNPLIGKNSYACTVSTPDPQAGVYGCSITQGHKTYDDTNFEVTIAPV